MQGSNEPQQNELLESALKYAKRGWAVIPIDPYSKKPLTPHGCKDAQKTTESIKAWWDQWPNANIGIATGSASNLIVIDEDVDDKKGLDGVHEVTLWEFENGDLPETAVSITGRGGRHLFFKYEGSDIKNKVGIIEGVDIRGEGGYIVAPPSIHPNGNRYHWETSPDEIKVAKVNKTVKQFLSAGSTNNHKEEYKKFEIPEKINEGQRNSILFKLACSLQSQGFSDDSIRELVKIENQNRCTDPLDDGEIETIISSAMRYEKGNLIESMQYKPEQGELDLYQFHHIDAHGNVKGVFDYAILEHLKNEGGLFVLGSIPYLYENGVFKRDMVGTKLKTMIRKLILPDFVKSTTIKRIYDLVISDNEIQTSTDEINSYPVEWINFQNGFYDPVNKTMIQHDPKYKATNQIPHDFDPDKETDLEPIKEWLDFICESSDDFKMLCQFCGLCLNRDTRQQKFLVLKGEGGTGKSTLIRLVENMVGSDNMSNISLDQLTQRFAAFGLLGKLINTCADLEIDALSDVSTLKKILGEDTISAEAKGKDAISFKSYAKLIFSTNELPIVKSEKTNGFYRRLLILPMEKIPKNKDPRFTEKMIKNIDAFILLCVNHLEDLYHSEGRITESKKSVEAVRKLRSASDTIEAFFEEFLIKDLTRRIRKPTLYVVYSDYCKKMERQPLTKFNFFRAMETKGFYPRKSEGYEYYYGLGWNEEHEDGEWKFSDSIWVERYQIEEMGLSSKIEQRK